MIFRRYYTLQSSKNADEVKRNLIGQHLKVHVLDFEVSVRDGDVKIIPHAEDEDHIYTLPITRLRITNNSKGSSIKMMSKPRRIDIGGPYLIMIFITFMIIASILLYFFGGLAYHLTAYIVAGIAILIFSLLMFRLEMGYFDYIRKIKNWVKAHV